MSNSVEHEEARTHPITVTMSRAPAAEVDAGTHVARLHDTQYERFWNCALVNMNQNQIKSADDLEFQLDKRAAHFGKPYAATLDKCGEDLAAMERMQARS